MNTKTQELVSIIIPTYNDSNNLMEAINSCLNQDYKNIEILICDDGSIDPTENIVKEYQKKYPNVVRYFKLKHSESPAIARNVGLKNVKGEFISFLDSDDLMCKNKLTRQVLLLRQNSSIDIVCSNAIKFSVPLEEKGLYHKDLKEGYIFLKDMLSGNKVINSSILMRKKLIHDMELLYERKFYLKNIKKFFYEDYEYWLRALILQKTIYYLPETLTKYRINNLGISSNSTKEKEIQGKINTLLISSKITSINKEDRKNILKKIKFYKKYLYKIKLKTIIKKYFLDNENPPHN